MKNFQLFTLALLCATTFVKAQSFNTEIISEKGTPTLLGKINKEGLSTNSYAWFEKNFNNYLPKNEAIDTLKRHLYKYTITAFMGTWCGDSKREVPKFYKVLEAAQFPLERLTNIAVSREKHTYKQSPGGEQEALNIHRVPTFIIYKNGKEINRIIESPIASIEEDLVNIIKKEYTPNYKGVTLLHELLTEVDTKRFHKKQKKLLPQLKREVKNMYELNTYANVLFFSHQKEEAILAARLNTMLFPKETKTFESLANKLSANGDTKNAIENYQKALTLNPENESSRTALDNLRKNEEEE